MKFIAMNRFCCKGPLSKGFIAGWMSLPALRNTACVTAVFVIMRRASGRLSFYSAQMPAKSPDSMLSATSKEEGWKETEPFSKDENDYVRMELF
ncbi:MAG: hypothetical protein WCJ02_03020 [bacterium]